VRRADDREPEVPARRGLVDAHAPGTKVLIGAERPAADVATDAAALGVAQPFERRAVGLGEGGVDQVAVPIDRLVGGLANVRGVIWQGHAMGGRALRGLAG
jgi:hypothetical protein